jgi:4-hydroxy-2-oxoheptanedioate aldolase
VAWGLLAPGAVSESGRFRQGAAGHPKGAREAPQRANVAYALNPRPDNPDPGHIATCDKIRDTAHKHGIKACIHCASSTFAAGAVKRGYDLVMVTLDLASMIAGVRRHLDDLKAAMA